MRELKGGWLEEFSEAWSEVCPCQSHYSTYIIAYRDVPPLQVNQYLHQLEARCYKYASALRGVMPA